jgi:nucleoside-diphosphate-sugar epimerase
MQNNRKLGNVLITGGAGYLGQELLKAAIPISDSITSIDLNINLNQYVTNYVLDIRNFSDLDAKFKGINTVFHAVAQVPLANDKNVLRSVNITGTKNVLEASLKNDVQKVVFISSSAVYGVPKSNPVTEKTERKPFEDYGKAKLAAEILCEEFVNKGLDISIIRPRTIIGGSRLGIFSIIFSLINQGLNIYVSGSGKNIYQFVHLNDLVSAILKSATIVGSNQYNIGSADHSSLIENLESLCSYANTGSRVVKIPKSLAANGMELMRVLGLSPLSPYHSKMYSESLYFDISFARKILGWEPKYSNIDALRESYTEFCRSDKRNNVNGSMHQNLLNPGFVLNLIISFNKIWQNYFKPSTYLKFKSKK